VAVNLASVANVYGSFLNNMTPTNGAFDTESWAYSANLLAQSISALGVPFYFGTPGAANGVSNITVPLPAGSFQSIYLAGAGVNGNQTSQSFVVTYGDGTTSTFTQSMSDWCSPQNYTGETTALTMTYRVSPGSGTVPLACNIYAYSFALNSAKTLSSITLPSNRNAAFMAITLSGGSAAAAALQAQTITFNAIPSQIVGGTLTLSATASSGLPVSFSIVQNGNCSISGAVVTFLNTGNCGVNANQAGNSAYAAAPTVGQIIVVNNPPAKTTTAQTITFGAISAQPVGTSLTLTATASSGLPVTYTVVPNGNCSVSGSVVTLLNTGNCGVIATQAGNGSYSAAAAVGQIIVVVNAATGSFTIAPSASSFTLAAGKGGTVNFTATPANGFNGTVTYSLSGSPLNPATSGISYTFLQQSSTVSTLVIYVSSGVASGSGKITVTGTSGSLSASTTFTFNY
jgi:hypothetical protein